MDVYMVPKTPVPVTRDWAYIPAKAIMACKKQ